MFLIVIVLILVIVLIKYYEQQEVEDCSTCGGQKEYLEEDNLNPLIEPSKTYLSEMVDATFTEAQQLNHAAYVEKRRESGDNTVQLWGTKTDIVYPRAYGIRPKRAVISDPYASQQYSQMGTPDLKAPKEIRLF